MWCKQIYVFSPGYGVVVVAAAVVTTWVSWVSSTGKGSYVKVLAVVTSVASVGACVGSSEHGCVNGDAVNTHRKI
ncbi:hypothetical protein O3P69_019157 [Scylla paramamosain]|uniref:Transmembrane protein n=1 Tax=Scylla paramamosain TaxID=85552 RepID=A0AAW0SWQ2_SCYPA